MVTCFIRFEWPFLSLYIFNVFEFFYSCSFYAKLYPIMYAAITIINYCNATCSCSSHLCSDYVCLVITYSE